MLPGKLRHQTILRAVLDAYASEPDILTIGVFGSLARGDGAGSSDIDLDVLVADETMPAACSKIQHLVDYLNAHGLPVLLTAWDAEGDAAAEILLTTFERLDITLHPPHTSKAEVLQNLILIRGDREVLPVQGIPAVTADQATALIVYLHDKLPILALYAADKLRQGKLWTAVLALQDMRDAIIRIYGLAHGSTLPQRYFAKEAPPELQVGLGASLTTYETRSMANGLHSLIDFYSAQSERISNWRLVISESQVRAFEQARTLLQEI